MRADQHRRELPPLVLLAQRVVERTPVAVVAVAVGLVTFFVHGYRLSIAPDIFSDEGSYLIVGANVARGIGLVENGSVFLWHSPVYMLIEAVYIKLTGLTYADPLAALLSVRYLNIFFSAITAALLMLFGRKLHSYRVGLVAAALFLMDPYVQRINRRGMLETLALLFVLLGLYIFFTHRVRLTKWQHLGAGIAFGLAMLTKEPMFLELLALIIYVALFRRSQLRDVARVAAIACIVYLPYPAWSVAVGQGDNYLSYKVFGVMRIIGSLTGHLPTSPQLLTTTANVPLQDTLWIRLIQYGMSYLLIALAAIFTLVLILRFRHLEAGRYLITWSIFSFGFGLTLGNVSDQYFYYLIVPSTIVVGYGLALLFEAGLRPRLHVQRTFLGEGENKGAPPTGDHKGNKATPHRSHPPSPLRTIGRVKLMPMGRAAPPTGDHKGNKATPHRSHPPSPLRTIGRVFVKLTPMGRTPASPFPKMSLVFALEYKLVWRLLFAVFFVILVYNGFVWAKTYAFGSDDGYINIIKYVRTHIPSGATIVTSDDVPLYFLSPSYNVRLDRDTKMIVDMHESYFIMSSKDAWGEYDATTPQFYNWVVRNSRSLFEQDDQSFWKLGVYELSDGLPVPQTGFACAPGRVPQGRQPRVGRANASWFRIQMLDGRPQGRQPRVGRANASWFRIQMLDGRPQGPQPRIPASPAPTIQRIGPPRPWMWGWGPCGQYLSKREKEVVVGAAGDHKGPPRRIPAALAPTDWRAKRSPKAVYRRGRRGCGRGDGAFVANTLQIGRREVVGTDGRP